MTTMNDTIENHRCSSTANPHSPIPIAYLITYHTYGTWLHGEEDGSIDRRQNEFGTPAFPASSEYIQRAQALMDQPEYCMDAPRRAIVLQTILEVCSTRGWTLFAAHVRTNHVHVVVHAPQDPERVAGDFKAYASRNMNSANFDFHDRKRWSRHGSTRYLWRNEDVEAAIRYVVDEQGEPMAVFENTSRTVND